MLHSKTHAAFARFTLATLAACICQASWAHTEIRDEAIEGTVSYNAITIGHGCENPPPQKNLPIIAESVLIPTVSPTVTRTDTQAAVDLSTVIDSPIGLAGSINLPQDKNIFRIQEKITDSNGNAIGFYGKNGKLSTELLGIVPFQFTPPSFLPTSCAKSLRIEIAVADICQMRFPPKPGKANYWIPTTTTKFTDPNNDGIGNPAVLIVNRNLDTHPLDSSCNGGYDVTVSPSVTDIDDNLVFKGWGKR